MGRDAVRDRRRARSDGTACLPGRGAGREPLARAAYAERDDGLRFPSRAGGRQADRDQHQCRRRLPRGVARREPAQLLRADGRIPRYAHQRARCAGALVRRFPARVAAGARRAAARSRADRRRYAGAAVPLPRVPAVPRAVPPSWRRMRHRRCIPARVRRRVRCAMQARRSISSTTAARISPCRMPHTRRCARHIAPTRWCSRLRRATTRCMPTSASWCGCPTMASSPASARARPCAACWRRTCRGPDS